jgi:hypothetical protein
VPQFVAILVLSQRAVTLLARSVQIGVADKVHEECAGYRE